MINTREIAEEYRLSHWTGIMSEQQASGLSKKAYCASIGIHENIFYYWQRKLREVACTELTKSQEIASSVTSPHFIEVKQPMQAELLRTEVGRGQIIIEISGMHIEADSEYPASKLAELLRGVATEC